MVHPRKKGDLVVGVGTGGNGGWGKGRRDGGREFILLDRDRLAIAQQICFSISLSFICMSLALCKAMHRRLHRRLIDLLSLPLLARLLLSGEDPFNMNTHHSFPLLGLAIPSMRQSLTRLACVS